MIDLYFVGIDIGSTAAKVTTFKDDRIYDNFIMPTGWSSLETAKLIENKLLEKNIDKSNSIVVATGYGRISVPYADKTVTEITCHGKGAYFLNGRKPQEVIIDIGGQDTKIITIVNGNVTNFTMNDKCAAGTGRFLELMANTLGVSLSELSQMAQNGNLIKISSMCTVFAESEVISLIGSGKKREDIARGVIDSIISRVKSLCNKHSDNFGYFLTGGLSENEYIVKCLSDRLEKPVNTHTLSKYAGSIGAALIASGLGGTNK